MEIVVKRKDQITLTAQALFKQRGYAATSMRDLAKAVGIEPASLYSHIKSKEELLSNICHQMADEFLEQLEQIMLTQQLPQLALRQAIVAHSQVIANNLDASSVFFNEWRHLTGTDLVMFRQKRQRYEETVGNMIEMGIQQQVFKPMDVHFALKVLFAGVNGMHEWYRPEGKLTPTEIGNKMTDLLLTGWLDKGHESLTNNQ